MKKLKRKLLGYVGVDSGQLMITDPCYINSEWKPTDFIDNRNYQHIKTKTYYLFASPFGLKPATSTLKLHAKKAEIFLRYDQKMSNGKTINEMIANKELKEIEVPEKKALIGDYSYAGACETNNEGKHELNFKSGITGAGLVFSSGYGDGVYPVYGTFNDDNRCVYIEIDCGLTKSQKAFLKTMPKEPK